MAGLQGATAGGEPVLLHRYVIGGELQTEAARDLARCLRRAAAHILAVAEHHLPLAIQLVAVTTHNVYWITVRITNRNMVSIGGKAANGTGK